MIDAATAVMRYIAIYQAARFTGPTAAATTSKRSRSEMEDDEKERLSSWQDTGGAIK